MNQYLQEYIKLKKNFEECDGNKASVVALYEFADRLAKCSEQEAKEVLVNVYRILGLMKSAFQLFSGFADLNDRKQHTKYLTLRKFSDSQGDSYPLPKPLTELELKEREAKLAKLPKFRYHPDPLATEAFEEGEAKICPCCGKQSTIYYSTRPYCRENVDNLCPECIANGKAAEKYDAIFIQGADLDEPDREKEDELFHRTPGYISWQGEYWLSCCNDYCEYLGSVGTQELKAMDIAEEVLAEYEARNEYPDVADYLVKDGSLCGYLFRCLHCEKYHLWVDAD